MEGVLTMSDIVERLAGNLWEETAGSSIALANLCQDAASEITRLRTEIAAARAAENEACAIIANHAGHKWASAAKKEKTVAGQAVFESASDTAFEIQLAIRARMEAEGE